MSDFEKPTTISAAVQFLARHTEGAPFPHFGGTRERSAAIRRRVARRSTEELEYSLLLARALAESDIRLTREEDSAIYEATHEIRAELDARRQKEK